MQQHVKGRACKVSTKLRTQRTMRKVVEESRPVLISSRNSVFLGPTTISPAMHVTLALRVLFCSILWRRRPKGVPSEGRKVVKAEALSVASVQHDQCWRKQETRMRDAERRPVVTRFFCPPLMPRTMSLPTSVSWHTCAS